MVNVNKIIAPRLKTHSLYWMQAVHGASYKYRPKGFFKTFLYYLLYPRLYLKNKSRNNGTFFVDELIFGANPLLAIKRINELETIAKDVRVGVIVYNTPDYWAYCAMPGIFSKKFNIKEDDCLGAIKELMFKKYKHVKLYFYNLDVMGVVGLKWDNDDFFLATLQRNSGKSFDTNGYDFQTILEVNNSIREKYRDAFFEHIDMLSKNGAIKAYEVEYPESKEEMGYIVSKTLCLTSSISYVLKEDWNGVSQDAKTIIHPDLDNGVVLKMGSGKMVGNGFMRQLELSSKEIFSE